MDHYHKFRFGLIGLELPVKVDQSTIMFDFYNGDQLIKSFWMKDGSVNHIFEYNNDLKFLRVVIRTVDENKILGDVLLTLQFIQEWNLRDTNEQWIPITEDSSQDFYSQDFNSYRLEAPCIMIRFERIWTPPPSPEQVIPNDLSMEKEEIREPYGYEEPPIEEPNSPEIQEYIPETPDYQPESNDYVPASQEYVQEPQESYPEPEEITEEPVILPDPEPVVENSPPREKSPPRELPKKASLRRRENPQNMPMQIPQQHAVM